ncbi:MAG TPA: hypothetical protein VIX63_14705 [Vicinamibacterales bacterium]
MAGPAGTLAVEAAVADPFPIPFGTPPTTKIVNLEYSIAGPTITLTNVPTDGRYVVGLRVRATDSHGTVRIAHALATLTGHSVWIDGFAERLVFCSAEQAKKQHRVSTAWPDFGEPDPKDLLDIVLLLADSADHEAEVLLGAMALKYGERLYRAMDMLRVGRRSSSTLVQRS